MSQHLYLNCSETTTGPFAVEELRARHTAGTLPPDALIHDGQAWLPAADFLNRLTAPAPMAIPAPAASPPQASGRASDPDAALQEALRLEPKPSPLVDAARWESWLFILSFPVLIPSLIFAFVGAKRWGHIDIYLILVDGLLLTGIGFLNSPLVGVAMLASWLSSVLLYSIRRAGFTRPACSKRRTRVELIR